MSVLKKDLQTLAEALGSSTSNQNERPSKFDPREFVKRFRYKEFWEFDVRRMAAVDMWELTVVAMVPERETRRMTRILSRAMLPYLVDGENFYQYLRATIADLEMHEMREWLRFDGKLIDDPHKEERPDYGIFQKPVERRTDYFGSFAGLGVSGNRLYTNFEP